MNNMFILFNVDDVALGAAAAHVGQTLRDLQVSGSVVTSPAVGALGVLCPALEMLSLDRCPLVGADGTRALARACGRSLQFVHESGCEAGTGRGFLEGLLESQHPDGALPLRSFTSDSLAPADICAVFAAALSGALANLAEVWVLAGTRQVALEDTTGAAVAAIATACPALQDLRFDCGLSAAGAVALAMCCPRLRRVSATTLPGDAEAPALLLRPSLESLCLTGAVASPRIPAGLAQCSGALAELKLCGRPEPLHITTGLAESVVALRGLRSLCLVCSSHRSNVDPKALAELSKCAPLYSLTLQGLALPEEFFAGAACSSLARAEFLRTALSDSALAALPAERLRHLELAAPSGVSADGVAALLGRATDLELLVLRGVSRDVGNDRMMAAIVPCLARMPRLARLLLGLPSATDAGAMLLATACARLKELQLNMPRATALGTVALLGLAASARTVGLRKCAGFSHRLLSTLRPCVTKLVLDPSAMLEVEGSSFGGDRPWVDVVYEQELLA
eukprot:m51a1_g12976 hypothetical protein (510) ;mRNA; f:59-1797